MSGYTNQFAKLSHSKNSEPEIQFQVRENSLDAHKSRQAVKREESKLNDKIDIQPVNNPNQGKQHKSKPKILQKSFQGGIVSQSASKEYKRPIQELNRNLYHQVGSFPNSFNEYGLDKKALESVLQAKQQKNLYMARQKPIAQKTVEENQIQDPISQVVEKGFHQVAQRVRQVTEQNDTLRKQNASPRRGIELASEKEKILFVQLQQQSFLSLSKQFQLQQLSIQALNKQLEFQRQQQRQLQQQSTQALSKQLQLQHQQNLKLSAQSKEQNRKYEKYLQENIGLNRQVQLQKKTIQNMKAEIQKKDEMADGYQRIVILLKENRLLNRTKGAVSQICEDLKYSLKGMTQSPNNKNEKVKKIDTLSNKQIMPENPIIAQENWRYDITSEELRNGNQIKNNNVQPNVVMKLFQNFTAGYNQNHQMLKYAKAIQQKLQTQKLSREFNFNKQRRSFDEKLRELQTYSMFNTVVDTLLKRYSEVINQMLTIGIYLDDHVKADFNQMRQIHKIHFEPTPSLGQQLGMIDQSLEGEQVVSRIIEGIKGKVQGIARSKNHVFTDMITIRDGKERYYMGEKKRFEDQITKQNKSIKSLEEHLSSKEAALTKKTSEFAKLISEHSKVQKRWKQLGEQNTQLNEQKNRLEADLSSKEKALSKKTQQFNKLSGEYQKLDKKWKQLGELNTELNAQKDRLQKDSKIMEQQLTLKVRSLENEKSEANRRIIELTESLNQSCQETKQIYEGLTKITTQLNSDVRILSLPDFQCFFRKYTLSSSLFYGSQMFPQTSSKEKETLINMLVNFNNKQVDSTHLIYSLDPLNLDYFKYLAQRSQSPKRYLILFKGKNMSVFGVFFEGVCFRESDNFTGFLFSLALDKEYLFPPQKQIDQKVSKVCYLEQNENYLYFGRKEMRIGKSKPNMITFTIGGLGKGYFDISSVSYLIGKEMKELIVQQLQIYTVKFK